MIENLAKLQTRRKKRKRVPPATKDGTRLIILGCSRASDPAILYEQPMLLPQLWQR